MSQKIHRGLWFLRLFMMCASLVGVLLTIEHLKHKKISLEAFTGAHAEEGITAKVDHSPDSLSKKNKEAEAGDSLQIDKDPGAH